jgi:pimeloyl-ACP methyl ester carboxylesterase
MLQGGQRLSFQGFGDPNGYPVFFFHGSPASRLEAEFLDEAAAKAGLRLVAPDRPGMGRSDPQPGRKLQDWPPQVEAIAAGLGLGRFSVMGFSTGALYVYACARALPDRIDGAVVVSGTGPPELMRGFNPGWLTLMAARTLPPLGNLLFGSVAARARRDPDGFEVPGLGRIDRAVLAEPRSRRLFLKSFGEAFRTGTEGVVQDQVLVTREWGFSPEEVMVPVVLWHGKDDRTVPSEVAVRMAARLPGGRARVLEGEGHISLLVRHGEEALAELEVGHGIARSGV